MLVISRFVCVLAAMSTTCAFGQATRSERLTGLAYVWGKVKYFHPSIPGRVKEWDDALLRAIPKVEAASTKEQYQAALNEMLSMLQDPATTVRGIAPAPATAPNDTGEQPRLDKKGNVGVIVATDYGKVLQSTKSLRAVAREALASGEIVLDIRNLGPQWPGRPLPFQDPGVVPALTVLLEKTLEIPAVMFQFHEGYPGQADRGGFSSTGDTYWSSLQVRGQHALRATGNKAPKRLTILINSGTPDLVAVLMGLQAQGVATVVAEGDIAAFEKNVTSMNLPHGLIATVRHKWLVANGEAKAFQPDLTIPVGTSASEARDRAAAFTAAPKTYSGRRVLTSEVSFAEADYADQRYPSREMRLLSLFRLWNVIENFFPYKQLMDKPWANALPAFIPKFEGAKNEEEYALAVAEMFTLIDDSHGDITATALPKTLVGQGPPLQILAIEGKAAITEIRDDALKAKGISVGDVIESVDGESAETRMAWLKDRIPASNADVKARRAAESVLLGTPSSTAKVTLRKADGTTQTHDIVRRAATSPPAAPGPVFQVLPSGFGYVDLGRLRPGEAKAAYDLIRAAPGVILDMRGYPVGGSFQLAWYLAVRKAPSARTVIPVLDGYIGRKRSRVEEQVIHPDPQFGYKGKVVVLINEYTQSAAEHTCLFIEAGHDVTFIGSPTSGANGNVTFAMLPGGIQVRFTGMEVYHGDGRQLQRVGVQPDILVRRTLAGVRAGRDELLEKAVEFLAGKG